jgi:exodeoxyribonuclease V alpha subunit
LKEYKPAYFLTVHKSQGSEFSHVRLLLPLEETPVLTKELLYTAVTRSREKFTLYGDLSMFASAVGKPAIRYTGLFQTHL